MNDFLGMCKNDNSDNDYLKYFKVKNIFKNKNKKFEEMLEIKNGIIIIYDNNNISNIINIYKYLEKNTNIINQIKQYFAVKVYELNEKEKYVKYIGYNTENVESIFFIKKGKDKKYIPNKFSLDIHNLSSIINKFKSKILEKNQELNKNKNLGINNLKIKQNNSKNINKSINNNNNNASQVNNTNIIISEIENGLNLNTYNENNLNILNNYNINEMKNNNNNINLDISKNINNNNELRKDYNDNSQEKNQYNYENNTLNKINNNKVQNSMAIYQLNNEKNNDFNNEYKFISSKIKNNLKGNEMFFQNKKENSLKKLPDEPNEDNFTTTITFIYPSNKIIKRNFNKDDKIELMYIYINTLTDDIFKELKQKNFLLSQPFPKKIYSNKEETFFEAGLYPDGIINIIPNDKNFY